MPVYSSEKLLKMFEASGASKKDVYTQYPVDRNTLNRWLSPGNDHLIDGYKVIRIANIIGVDPRLYFPQIQTVISEISSLDRAEDPQLQYLNMLIDGTAAGDAASVDALKAESAKLVAENKRYREELLRVMQDLKKI